MRIDEPTVRTPTRPPIEWGSDAIAEVLNRLDLPYISLTPGASYRGLHDSLINYLGNEQPAMILCLHEEHAVAVAHGWAKVTGRPLAVGLHSNVGLMHASMAIFNAFLDRVPMVLLGATGPVDAPERRPWIDWIHTSADQGALIRDFSKWDDQPASAAAAVEAIARGHQLTCTHPAAPVYINLDAAVQEGRLQEAVPIPDVARLAPPAPPSPSAADVEHVAERLLSAERPLILLGRSGRQTADWDARVRIAEKVGAVVLTDLKMGAAFPTDHPLHPAPPASFLGSEGQALLRRADAVLALDWTDLGSTLHQAFGDAPIAADVTSCSLDFTLYNGWSKDYGALPPVDRSIAANPDELVRALDERLRAATPRQHDGWPGTVDPQPDGALDGGGEIVLRQLASRLQAALAGQRPSFVRLPLGWNGYDLHTAHPLDYLGADGGAGIGSGPGMAVGAALALQGSGRLPVAVLGDGDYLMSASALWTAAHYQLPLLVVVANNRSFFNDEVHQQRMALQRDRAVENRWVGQHIRTPDPDLAGLARSLGCAGHGPVSDPADLEPALAAAVRDAAAGATVVVDVRVAPTGYPGGPSAGRRKG